MIIIVSRLKSTLNYGPATHVKKNNTNNMRFEKICHNPEGRVVMADYVCRMVILSISFLNTKDVASDSFLRLKRKIVVKAVSLRQKFFIWCNQIRSSYFRIA